jgi:hypothetical protein
MNLARFPRVRFGHLPTPLEHFPNLTRHLNGPEIWIKRDDCTRMSTGGNKTRKLEFLMAEARDQSAGDDVPNDDSLCVPVKPTVSNRCFPCIPCRPIFIDRRHGFSLG